MKRVFSLCALLALFAVPAFAQVKEVPGDKLTKSVTIEAINQGTRELTVKQEDGTYLTFEASKDIKRFDELKVGDKIPARYYENLVLRVKKPGEKDVDTAAAATTPSQTSTRGRARSSGRSPRRSPPSTRRSRRSPSTGRTAGSTPRGSRTRSCSRR